MGNKNTITCIFMCILFACFICLCSNISIYASEGDDCIYDLTVNGEESIIGLGDSTPFFSWKMKSSDVGAKQKSYRIIVYRADDYVDVWDSGVIESDESNCIEYMGSPLEECTAYNWKVTVTDQNDKMLESTGAGFETAYFGNGLGNAKWIKAKKKSDTDNNVVMFRTSFDFMEKHVSKARIYASSLGVFDIYINGKRVGRKDSSDNIIYDELKPGWTDYNERVMYYTYDITDYFYDGKNIVLSEVAPGWFSGRISTMRTAGEGYGSDDVSFICKINVEYTDGTSDTFTTDESWKTSMNGPYISADIYDGEAYDAGLEENYYSPDYNDSAWDTAVYSTDCKGKLIAKEGTTVNVRDDLEQHPVSYTVYEGIKDNGSAFGEVNVLSHPAVSSPVTIKKGQTLQADFGQNIVGWLCITVKGDAGSSYEIKFAEMLNDSGDDNRANDGAKGSLYRANYRTAKATLKYTLSGNVSGETYASKFSFYGFRYIEIEATEDITIQDIKGQVITSIKNETGSIVTSNNNVNKLYRNILWGQYGNYLSIATDCPQRDERHGWTGDTQVFINTAVYNSDVNSFYIKWLNDANDNLKRFGAYQATIPTAGFKGVMSGWSDAGVIVPYNLYKMYGNKRYLRDNYAGMKQYITYLGENGSAYSRSAYGDWLSYESTPIVYCNLAYYCYVTGLMSEIAKELGKADDTKYYNDLSQKAVKEFQGKYLKKNGDLNISSQCAYLMALYYDLLPDDESREICTIQLRKKIIENGYSLSTGFLGTAILEQGLSDNDLSDLSYDLLLQTNNPSWLYQVQNGATTVWERWNSYTSEYGFGSKSMNSFNHYAYGCVGEWMYAYMAGIRPDEETYGFKHFLLEPCIDGRTSDAIPKGQTKITKVTATYNSSYGTICSAWDTKKDGSVLYYEAAVPANTDATIRLKLPRDADKLFINGKENNIDLKDLSDNTSISKGLVFLGCVLTEEYVIYEFSALSGTYSFDFTGDAKYEIKVDKRLLKEIKDAEESTSEKTTKSDKTTENKTTEDNTTEEIVNANPVVIKATSIKKLTRGKKGFTIKWKKIKGITGYQIQYSTKKSFKSKKTITIKKKSTTSRKIKKLKAKKKYYVRIRTYKLINGKKKYSKWSKIKTVKTK